jgi:hypothetical protein
MLTYIFWAIVAYLAIRFIFNFVIPVFRATKQMRNQVKDFHAKMQEQQQAAGTSYQHHDEAQRQKVNKGEYIDFEEVK